MEPPIVTFLYLLLILIILVGPAVLILTAVISLFTKRHRPLRTRYLRIILVCSSAAALLWVISIVTPVGYHADTPISFVRLELEGGRATFQSWPYNHFRQSRFGFHLPGAFPSVNDGNSGITITNADNVIGITVEYIGIPMWFLAYFMSGSCIGFAWWRARKQPDPALCPRCKYDISACTTDRCPECGKPIPSDRTAPE